MIVVDTSALMAVLFREPDAERYARCLAETTRASMSVVGYVELGMVTTSNRSLPRAELDAWLRQLRVRIVAVSERQGQRALEAFLAYGKGRHPARLNIGDCFAYALAKELGWPLLFKGGDFALTDVEPAA